MSNFTLAEITDASWPQIIRIQADVYVDIEPESLETLRSKWLNSPECCLLGETGQEVCAYLLAHAWQSDTPPSLYQSAPPLPQGDILFIHDLAVSKRAAGKGVGTMMVTHLLARAKARGFRRVLLVAVQNSVPFWRKFGFHIRADSHASAHYGHGAVVMHRPLDDALN